MLTRQMVTPVLIGRRQELEALERALDRAAAGQGTTVLVAGDAGIGKTRLCRELKVSAARRRARVIEGHSSLPESVIPFGPFMNALRIRLADEEVPTVSPFDRVVSVLQSLTADEPVLFILEDVHWADSTSLDLLQYIARRIGQMRVMVVATYRSDEPTAGPGAQRLAAALSRQRNALRVNLETLDREEVGQMLHGLMGIEPAGEFVDAVMARTEGNPLFIEEVISALAQAYAQHWPHLQAADLRGFPVPVTLHEMVWERLGPLDETLYEVLAVASVIGREFSFDILSAAIGWKEDRLLAAIEQLIELRVLEDTSARPGEAIAFRHSIVQEVVYASVIGRRRRMWHRRVAAVLDGSKVPVPHTVLAYHYDLGGEPEQARRHRVHAGDDAARVCAWKDAESLYEAALADLERSGGAAAEEADILERMAEVAWWQNRVPALEQYLNEALAIRRTLGDTQRAAKLLRRLANVLAYQRNEPARASAALREALDLVNSGDAERIFLLNDLGRLLLAGGQLAEAAPLFEESLGLSARRGDVAEESLSLVMLGRLAIHDAQVTTGVSRLELARALLEEQALAPERATEVFHAGVRALEGVREHKRAAVWVEAALSYTRQHAAYAELAIFHAYEAAVKRRSGEWQSALAIATEAVRELRRSGRTELREALRILGDIQRLRGELDAARAAYEEALSLGESTAAIGLSLLFAAEQRWDQAATRLTAALRAQPGDDRLFALRVLPILIEAHAAAGALPDARTQLERMGQLLEARDYPPGRPAYAYAKAKIDQAADDDAAALEAARRALEGWRALELPYEAARAELLVAELLAAAGAPREEWLAPASSALASFERLGAVLDASRAGRVLRSAGVRVKRSRKQPIDLPEPLSRLTQREIQVLTELARGRTNKQIARTLSMSPKTVGNHVSAILAKLECSTRTEASRYALRPQ